MIKSLFLLLLVDGMWMKSICPTGKY
jgi:hypothetical protein